MYRYNKNVYIGAFMFYENGVNCALIEQKL